MKGYQFKRKVSLEERKEIIALYLEGYAILKIAKEYGIDHTTVVYHTRKVRHLRKKKKSRNTDIGQVGEEVVIPEEKPKISKELKEEMKLYPNRKIYGKLTPKGLTYADYQRIEEEKKK